jgi:hypothetical protein
MLIGSLVEKLFELGAPISLSASDAILCEDIELLRQMEPVQRRAALRKAKRDALQQYLCDCIDQIAEAAGDGRLDLETLLGGFVGTDSPVTPVTHATLHQQFYGAPLSTRDIERWNRLANAAAQQPTGEDREPIVYFLSTDDPTKVKIGYSAKFKHRLRALRTASPADPTVHLTIPGDKRFEAELRERFKADHIRREWFKFSTEIKAFIATAAQRSIG